MKPNIYELTSQYYDLGNDGVGYSRDDLDFYLKIFHKNQSVLEVGCGTGRVGIELSEAGINISGLDLSKQMLDVYKAKLKAKPFNTIDLHNVDMTNFDLHNTFDGIIFPFRVFQALQNELDRIKCLNCVAKHMDENSICIICMFNPHPEILKNWGKKGVIDFDVHIPNENCNLRKITNQINHDGAKQVIVVESIYQKYIGEKILEEFHDRFELGYLFPNQATTLFLKANFKIDATYGNWDCSKIVADDYKEQIYILKKQ